jgi:hypothetical protein
MTGILILHLSNVDHHALLTINMILSLKHAPYARLELGTTLFRKIARIVHRHHANPAIMQHK